MSNITVWTKQHENVLKELETTGRYIAKREYIRMDLKEQAPVVLEAYDWLVKHRTERINRQTWSIRYGCHLPTKEQ